MIKKLSAIQWMVHVNVRMDGRVKTAQSGRVRAVCMEKTVIKCASVHQTTLKCAIHGQASVNVKKVGTEYCAQDLAPFTPLAKAAGVFAPAKTTHSAYLTMEHAFVLQVIEVTTAAMFVPKERSVRIAHNAVSVKTQHIVPPILDDASANQVGWDSSATDLATNTFMGTTAHNSASVRTMLLANHRTVLVNVRRAMQVNFVTIGVNKDHMAEVVNRSAIVSKKIHLAVIL